MGKDSNKDTRRKQLLTVITDELITPEDLGFMHTTLAQCFLPRRSIKEKKYKSQHGKAIVSVTAGEIFDGNDLIEMDVPSGPKSRLIMTYVNTYATKHKTSTIDMGESLNDFLAKMDVPIGGKNFKATMRELNNIAAAQMTFGGWDGEEVVTKYARVMDKVSLWKHRNEAQMSLWPSEGHLSQEYLDILAEHRMPIDLRVIKALQNSALEMDIYSFLSYRLQRLKAPTKIKWETMHAVFGAEYTRMRAFRDRFRIVIKNIHPFYPEARLDISSNDYFTMYPSKSPVPKNVFVSKGIPKGQGAIETDKKTDGIAISEKALEDARAINRAADVSWDFQVILQEFKTWNANKKLKSVDRAFIGFVKKKVQNAP